MRPIDFHDLAKQHFWFLVTHYGFRRIYLKSIPYVVKLRFVKDDFSLTLDYHFYDQRFDFYMNDGISGISFWDLFLTYEPSLDPDELRQTFNDFQVPLKANAEYLKKYGKEVLTTLRIP